jgi:hypothetical protein
MKCGVPKTYESPRGDFLAVGQRPFSRTMGNTFRAGLVMLGSLSTLLFASSALGATERSGSDASAARTASGGDHSQAASHQSSGHSSRSHDSGGGGCTGGGGSPPAGSPPVGSPPVGSPPAGVKVTEPTGGVTETTGSVKETPAGGVEAATASAAPAAPGVVTITVRPASGSSTTTVKAAAKRAKKPAKKPVKRRVKKHPKADGAGTERSYARSPLPNKRAAFTG